MIAAIVSNSRPESLMFLPSTSTSRCSPKWSSSFATADMFSIIFSRRAPNIHLKECPACAKGGSKPFGSSAERKGEQECLAFGVEPESDGA
jgi:hypothetical protein